MLDTTYKVHLENLDEWFMLEDSELLKDNSLDFEDDYDLTTYLQLEMLKEG